MTYPHIVIVDDSDSTGVGAWHFNNSTLVEAILYFRKHSENANGVCVVYTGKTWRFIGYLNQIIV